MDDSGLITVSDVDALKGIVINNEFHLIGNDKHIKFIEKSLKITKVENH